MTSRNQQHSSRRLLGVASVVALVSAIVTMPAFVGCNNAQDSIVSGRVTMDGKPLDHGRVLFSNAGGAASTPASGSIQSDGSYQVQIGLSGEMVAGEYAVSISSRAPSIPSPEGGPPTPGELLTPAKYASSSTSGLRYQVREGANVIDIALASEPQETTSTGDSGTTDSEEPPVEETGAAAPVDGKAVEEDATEDVAEQEAEASKSDS